MTIHTDRQTTTTTRVRVTGDTEAERNAVEDKLRSEGYTRELWLMKGGEAWAMLFVRDEVLAAYLRKVEAL